MNWRVNAYCPEGHLSTLNIEFPDDLEEGPTSMAFWAPETCKTCEELADLKSLKDRRREKRELRRFRKELKKLG